MVRDHTYHPYMHTPLYVSQEEQLHGSRGTSNQRAGASAPVPFFMKLGPSAWYLDFREEVVTTKIQAVV